VTASYVVLGEPINVAGVWLQPPKPTAGLFTTGDAIPVASLTGGLTEMNVLIARGAATQVA
jgi:hypothetical protein